MRLIIRTHCTAADFARGLPRKWERSYDDEHIAPDTEDVLLGYNRYRCPNAPMEPAIRALLHHEPETDFTGYDVVADKHPLADLLQLAYARVEDGPAGLSGTGEAFRFFAHIVGNTVILTRAGGNMVRTDVGTFTGFRKGYEELFLQKPHFSSKPTAHYHLTP